MGIRSPQVNGGHFPRSTTRAPSRLVFTLCKSPSTLPAALHRGGPELSLHPSPAPAPGALAPPLPSREAARGGHRQPQGSLGTSSQGRSCHPSAVFPLPPPSAPSLLPIGSLSYPNLVSRGNFLNSLLGRLSLSVCTSSEYLFPSPASSFMLFK